MATRVLPPSSIRSAVWYPQYQETNATISSLNNKKFGVTKRVKGIPATSLVPSKVTHLRTQYGDVNNGAIPYNNTWTTGRIEEIGGIRAILQKSYGGVLSNGQSVTEEFPSDSPNISSVTTNDIPAKYNYSGVRKNGSYQFYNGLNINVSIPSNGVVRMTLTNTSGGNIDLTNVNLFVYIFKTVQELAQATYNNYGVRKGSPFFAEFTENGVPYEKVEEIQEALYNIIKTNDPTVQSPADTELFSDYFEGLNGYSNDMLFGVNDNATQMRGILQNQASARNNIAYYNNAYKYRNRTVGGYFDGIRVMLDGAGIYSQVFNIERNYMAMNDRKVAVFGWGSFEGIGGSVDGSKWQRLPLETGDIIRLSRAQGSYAMTEVQAFLTLFLADTYVMWHDNGEYGTDVQCWDKAYIGGNEPWKTKFQKYGGSIEEYSDSNPTHLKRKENCTSSFSDSAADNLNGAFAGVHIYSTVRNRCNLKIKYPTFNFTDSTGNKTGYANGNTPVLGSKGDGSVNIMGNSNYGQTTSYDQWAAKKPLLFEGLGTEGDMIAVIYPRAGLTETITYNITTTNKGVQTITHTGPNLGVYTI